MLTKLEGAEQRYEHSGPQKSGIIHSAHDGILSNQDFSKESCPEKGSNTLTFPMHREALPGQTH